MIERQLKFTIEHNKLVPEYYKIGEFGDSVIEGHGEDRRLVKDGIRCLTFRQGRAGADT